MKTKNKEVKKIFRIVIMSILLTVIICMIPGYFVEVRDLPSNTLLNILNFIIWVLYEIFVKNFYITIVIFLLLLLCEKLILLILNAERIAKNIIESNRKTDLYYRDIIIEHSPAVIGYIHDFELDINDIVATLMSLELKGNIKIKKNIEIINNDIKNLSLNEKYILENITEKNTLEINMEKFKIMVINDCINSNLLSEKDFVGKTIISSLVYFSSWIWCVNVLDLISDNELLSNILDKCLTYYIFISPLIFFIQIFKKFYESANDPFIRNRKSKIINKKIKGLKNFINDFSKLDEKEYKHINLWKDYLIYSVILGDNKKIINQISKFIKIQY